MRNSLVGLLFGLLLLFIAYKLLSRGDNLISKEKFTEAESLCQSSEQTVGILSDSIMEKTLSISSVDVTTYELFYNFELNGRAYQAMTEVDSIGENVQAIKEIWYLVTDPSVNTVDDPCEKLQYYKENKKVGSNSPWNIIGLLLGFLGIGVTLNGISDFFRSLFSSKKNPEA